MRSKFLIERFKVNAQGLVACLLNEGWFSSRKAKTPTLFPGLSPADKVEVEGGIKRWELNEGHETYAIYMDDGWMHDPCIVLAVSGRNVGEVYLAGPGYVDDTGFKVPPGTLHVVSVQVRERRQGYATKLLQMAAKLNPHLDQISCQSTSRASASMVTKAFGWPAQSPDRTQDLPSEPKMDTGHTLLISGPNPYSR